MSKIALLTFYTPNYSSLGISVEENKKEYCLRHGYDFICPKTEEEYALFYQYKGFHKIHLILRLLEEKKYEYIHWSGIDAWIMNYNIRIEDWIDDKHDFFIAKEQSGDYKGSYNSDVFIIKNSEKGIKILNFLMEKSRDERYIYRGAHNWEEQQVMIDYFDNFEYKEAIKIMPHSSFNSYPWRFYGLDQAGDFYKYDGLPGCFKEGDFLMHTPGHVLHNRIRIFNFYKDKIIK